MMLENVDTIMQGHGHQRRGHAVKKFLILSIVFIVVGLIPALRYVDDDILLMDAVAKGFGRTLAIGLLSCIGLLFKRNRTLGFGIAAVVFTILSIVAVMTLSGKTEYNEDAVAGEITAAPDKCSLEFPLQVRLTNMSDKDVLNVGFQVQVSDAGHSTVYHSAAGSGMSTDFIIPPGHMIEECYPVPPFYSGGDAMALAPEIPSALLSPEYRVVITGARLRGDD